MRRHLDALARKRKRAFHLEDKMRKQRTTCVHTDIEDLLNETRNITNSDYLQDSAQKFMDRIFERFSDSLVLLRLFITLRYDQLTQEDRRFVGSRGLATNTSHLIHDGTPIFTLLGTRGEKPEWNDRKDSSLFRCIPLSSTAFIASLSMLSRQFECVGLDLDYIDTWETSVVSTGSANQFRGTLYIRDAATDKDAQGRMLVPKQDFVIANGVKSVFGFGSGYSNYPSLVTLFAFTKKDFAENALEPLTDLLEAFVTSTESLAGHERFFAEKTQQY